MLTKDVVKKIKKVEISARRAVNSLVGGEYHSVFKGRGMEFDEVRHYSPGDQISSIDWKVTARRGTPFVKRFVEERELTVVLVADVSASEDFGSVARSKRDLVTEVGALLAFSAIKNNDRVGLLTFSDRIESFIMPKKGRSHGMRVIRELVTLSPTGRGTSTVNALEYLGRLIKRRSIVFLISDFIDEGFEKQLNIISRKHDLVLIRIKDPMEAMLPDEGLVSLMDAETGEFITADPADRAWRESFTEISRRREAGWTDLLKRLKIDSIDLETGTPCVTPLCKFFKKRSRRY